MYDDLQDALGYRTDQNAPFNPTYSIASLPVSSCPINPAAAVPACRQTGAGRRSARHENAHPDLVVAARAAGTLPNTSLTVGYVGSHGYHEIIGIDGNEPIPVICPASPCPATIPARFPAHWPMLPIPAGTFYIPPWHAQADSESGQHVGPGSPWAIATTTHCKWT